MKVLILLSITLILTACAGRDRYQLPDWDLAAPTETEITDAVPLPLLCEAGAGGTWSAKCWTHMSEYEAVAERNTIAAQNYADGLRNSEQYQRELIGAAKVQQELGKIRQRLLEDEREAHKWDNWFYRGVIALGLLGAVL